MKKFFKVLMYVILGIIGLFIILFIATISGNSDYEPLPEKELSRAEKDSIAKIELTKRIDELEKQIEYQENYTWDANNLLHYFEQNEVKADNNFKNKKVYIKGKIQDFGKDVVNRPYITIGLYDYVSSVQCVFPENSSSIIAELQKGQNVVVKGVCKGKLLNVLFEDCELIKDVPELRKELSNLKNQI